jgi:hypothetical protein
MSSTARQSACARFWESPELVTHMMRGLPSLEQTVICRLNSRLFSIACKVVWSQPLKAGFFDWVFECLSNVSLDRLRLQTRGELTFRRALPTTNAVTFQ